MKAYLLLSFLFTLFFIFGCSSRNSVKVISFSAKDVVSTSTAFTVEFSRDLVGHEQIGEWTDKEYIQFEPRINGKYKWLSQNKLFFVPEKELAPMQEYEAEITDLVLEKSPYSSDFDSYDFKTPDFSLAKKQLNWKNIPNEYYKLSPVIQLGFSYPVNAAALKQNMSISLDGKPLQKYSLSGEENATDFSVDLGVVAQAEKDIAVRVVINENLKAAGGNASLDGTIIYEEKLPGIQKLKVNGVASGYDGVTGWIEIAFSQPVDENKVREFISLIKLNELSDTFNLGGGTGATRFVSEENFLRIETDFAAAQELKLAVKKGMPGIFGGTLEEEFVEELALADISPAITFSDSRGRYLMKSGLGNIGISAVNISDAEVEITRITKNNIVYFVTQNSYNFLQSGQEYYYPYYNTYNLGEVIHTAKLKLENRGNWLEQLTINLKERIGENEKGIYVVTIRSTDGNWANDSKVISLTDLGIIAKSGKDEISVFVNSIATTAPAAGAVVKILTLYNDVLCEGKTGKDGIAVFRGLTEKLKTRKPYVVEVEYKDDFNYLYMEESKVDYSRFDVTGKMLDNGGFNTYLYSQRDIYRPGETVFISGIVRDRNYQVVSDQPVTIKIIGPGGRIYEEYNKILNQQGSFEIAFKSAEYSQTGLYICEVSSGSGTLLENYLFNIEEFMPEKLRVKLEAEKKTVLKGGEVPLIIDAEYLFGAKASGLRYELTVKLRQRTFSSESLEGYNFGGAENQARQFEDFTTTGYLDDNGKGYINYLAPDVAIFNSVLEATAWVSVFDLTGRTVNRLATFSVIPGTNFIGILSPGYYYDVNTKVELKFASLNYDNSYAKDYPAVITVVRKEWQTVLKKDNNGRYTYTSQKKEILESQRDINLGGGIKKYNFTPVKSGEYEIRVSAKGSAEYVSSTIYAWGFGSSAASSFQVDKEGKVEIVADKKVYAPGEKAKILLTTPFSGRALVTIERDGVITSRYYDVTEKSKEITVDVKDEYKPNVYLNVTLFRKQSPDPESPLFVAYGVKSLNVERKSDKIPVSIRVPAKIKPNNEVEVVVNAGKESGVYVTLAAVDEGVLQIKNFQTPDPYTGIYSRRALGVESFNMYKLLLPELRAYHLSPGGDVALAEQMKRRINPITSKRVQPVAYWSGIKQTGGDGLVRLKVKIPQYNGDIRFMAVAYKMGRYGSTSANMKVADDLIIEPEAPRTISSADSLEGVVSIINTTNKKGSVKLNVSVSGPIQLTGASSGNLNIQPNGSVRFKYALKSTGGVGEGKLVFATEGLAKVKEEIIIPVKPANPFSVQSGSGTVRAGQTVTVKIPNDYWENTSSYSLVISKFPAVKFTKQIKALLGFPHGCLEQTISKAFPQLYFESLAKTAYPEFFRNNSSVYYVKEAIRKVESMQMYDGSMTYWQGGDYSNWWSSVYAAHFLVESRSAGYSVNDKTLERLLGYLSWKAKQPALYDRVVYSGDTKTYQKTASKEILYSLYVLSMAGNADLNLMNYYKSRSNLLTADSKYLLAGAYARAGKWNLFYETLPKAFTPGLNEGTNSITFDSPIRSDALMLNILLDTDPSNRNIPLMIKHISSSADVYLNTQEAAFVFLALGKAASKVKNYDIRLAVNKGGKEIGKYGGADISLSGKNLAGGDLSLKAEGTGEVYYFWSSEGIRKNVAPKEYDSYLSVRRNYFDLKSGRQITDNIFYQGQLLLCGISLKSGSAGAGNIAISDIVPAGFEIENPRTSIIPGMNSIRQSNFTPQYLDVRDDRVILFTDINPNEQKEYYYILRAVNKGKFILPAISANAMYDKEFTSVNGRSRVIVRDGNTMLAAK